MARLVPFLIKCSGQTGNEAVERCVEIGADINKSNWGKRKDKTRMPIKKTF